MKKTAPFKKDDVIYITNSDKDDESVKHPDGEQPNVEGGGRSYISLSPGEFSEIKSNKEKVFKKRDENKHKKNVKKNRRNQV